MRQELICIQNPELRIGKLFLHSFAITKHQSISALQLLWFACRVYELLLSSGWIPAAPDQGNALAAATVAAAAAPTATAAVASTGLADDGVLK